MLYARKLQNPKRCNDAHLGNGLLREKVKKVKWRVGSAHQSAPHAKLRSSQTGEFVVSQSVVSHQSWVGLSPVFAPAIEELTSALVDLWDSSKPRTGHTDSPSHFYSDIVRNSLSRFDNEMILLAVQVLPYY